MQKVMKISDKIRKVEGKLATMQKCGEQVKSWAVIGAQSAVDILNHIRDLYGEVDRIRSLMKDFVPESIANLTDEDVVTLTNMRNMKGVSKQTAKVLLEIIQIRAYE